MPRSAKNLAGHELIGLPVKVVRASDASLVGTGGTVVDETENLLVVERDTGHEEKGAREIRIPKSRDTVFRFALPTEEKRMVDIEGWTIRAKPEERTKRLARLLRSWR